MRQIWITRPGDVEVLELRDAPDPRPGPGEVLVDVRTVGINFADIMARMGMYPEAPPMPCVVGYEVSGIVDDTGIGVSTVAPGDRVLAVTRFGGYATRLCVPQEQVLRLPRGTEFTTGAALGVNYLTASLALFTMGNLSAGERVLIHSAGGGVGLAAVQLAATVNAEVYGTASENKH
jgi:NADPH:quinone reductase-like Zn-dependent oxidoreductase